MACVGALGILMLSPPSATVQEVGIDHVAELRENIVLVADRAIGNGIGRKTQYTGGRRQRRMCAEQMTWLDDVSLLG